MGGPGCGLVSVRPQGVFAIDAAAVAEDALMNIVLESAPTT